MTTRNFSALFSPHTIALIGASNRTGSVGNVLATNLLSGGFSGNLWFVNPHDRLILDAKAYRDIDDLPSAPDLAIIATPAATVTNLVARLGERGCRAAIIISAGDHAFRDSVLKAAQPYLMRIVGPNCLGFLSPGAGINASFAQLTPRAGHIALVTQSGAIATSLIDWAQGQGLGFSHVLSLGDMADIDFGDALDYLSLDTATSAILLYVEQITNARKFMSAARIAARLKPVIVVKAGRSAKGAAAAASHTGALAGSDAVYDAAFRRAGMLRVDTLRDLFDAAETLSYGMRPSGDRLMIISNGGGLGVLATDALETHGGRVAELSEASKSALDKVLPASWSRANPVDILGDAHGQRYADALDILAKDAGHDAVLVMNCPTGVADNREAAQAVADARRTHPTKPLIACWVGGASLAEPQAILSAAGAPTFEAPEEAVRAFAHLADYARNQKTLLETPAADAELAPDAVARVNAILADVRAEGRLILTEFEAKAVLAAYAVPITPTKIARDPLEAGRLAIEFGDLVAIKILSRDITHKSDIGGVLLDVDPAHAAEAARAMLERVATAQPDAHIDGFTVQPMIKRPQAQELILGLSIDRTFGPVILFGHGGVSVEIIGDRAMALPPLNSALAFDLIAHTRVSKLLAGYRGRAPADMAAIARALTALSILTINHPEITELDINPLLADDRGVIALDARIVIAAEGASSASLAICPYPHDLAHEIRLKDGSSFHVRPISPSDAPALLRLGQTTPQNLPLRFHGLIRTDSEFGAARLCQVDYHREMAFGAIEANGAIGGFARISFDPQFETGEFAVVVRNDLQRRGLGRALLSDVLSYAKSRGAIRAWADISSDHAALLALATELRASFETSGGTTRITFNLANQA